MSKIARKLGVAAIALVTIVSVSGITPAAAQTTAELQAQIAALLAQITALQAQLGGSTTTGGTTTTYNFTRDLTLGSTGEDVRALQQFLNGRGYTVAATGAGSVGNESTYFGELTRAALSKFQAANGISPTAGYFGAITRAKIASMGGTSTTPTTPAAGAMSISLASDTAPAANLQRGSANNQVLKLVITGGSTPVSITGLTLRSYGTVEATYTIPDPDITAVKLFDESGIQIGNDRTQTGNQVNFVIVPALTIPANSSRTLTVTVNTGTNATVMSTVRYGVESASAVMGGTFVGSFPIIGNSFTIVPAGQLGTLNAGDFGTPPKTSVRVGEKDVVLERFNVSAGSNEDIAINQVVLTRITGADTNVSNLRLRKVNESAVLAGPVSFTNKKATFNLPSPITLIKGASANFEVIGDMVEATASFSARVEIGGVVGRGLTSGTNVTSSTATTATAITTSNEGVSVSMSASHPQGNEGSIIKTGNRKDLAKFDVRAQGGQVILSSVVLGFNGQTDISGANKLTAVGIYDGDSLISDLKDITTDTSVDAGNVYTFSFNYTLPANTTRVLTVKGITSGYTAADDNGDTVTVTWVSGSGSGLASGETIATTAGVGTTPITIYGSGTSTLASDTTKVPYSQAIWAPSTNVTVASLRVYAQREDMKLSDLRVEFNSADLEDGDISSITLYADDGVTPLTDPISASTFAAGATDTFVVSSSDILNDIVFTKNTYKTILVKANVSSTADATGVTVHIPWAAGPIYGMILVGQDSGTVFNYANGNVDFDLTIATPYAGGTFSFKDEILTLQKASTSPSGSISRGSETVTGVWDVSNPTQTSRNITAIKFTSKSGLPSLADATDDILFKLYDGDGNPLKVLSVADDADVTISGNTVAFSGLTYAIGPNEPKQLRLVIDTTSSTKFPSNTQMQWSIEAVGDVTLSAGSVGYAAGTWTIPAVANTIQLP